MQAVLPIRGPMMAPYNVQQTDKKLVQAWLPQKLAVAVDVESTKRSGELGLAPRSAKASLIREALIQFLLKRGWQNADIT